MDEGRKRTRKPSTFKFNHIKLINYFVRLEKDTNFALKLF